MQSKMIEIAYILQGKKYEIKQDSDSTLGVLLSTISFKHSFPVSKFVLKFKNKEIQTLKDKKIKEITGKEEFPTFKFIEISIKSLKSFDKVSSNLNTVVVQNSPSRTEIYEHLDNFLQKSGLERSFILKTSGNSLLITFPQAIIASNFKIFLENLKKQNKFMKQTTTSLISTYQKLQPSKPMFKKINPTHANLSTEQSTKVYSTYATRNKMKTNFSLNRSNFLTDSSLVGGIRTSSPYISGFQQDLKEYKINKSKWIGKNDFSKYHNPHTEKMMIRNYVNLAVSESPLKYNFREINKAKWINRRNFQI